MALGPGRVTGEIGPSDIGLDVVRKSVMLQVAGRMPQEAIARLGHPLKPAGLLAAVARAVRPLRISEVTKHPLFRVLPPGSHVVINEIGLADLGVAEGGHGVEILALEVLDERVCGVSASPCSTASGRLRPGH
jgi:hypothetical protein